MSLYENKIINDLSMSILFIEYPSHTTIGWSSYQTTSYVS